MAGVEREKRTRLARLVERPGLRHDPVGGAPTGAAEAAALPKFKEDA